MIGLFLDAIIISLIASFFLKREDSGFQESLIPAVIIAFGNLFLAFLLVPTAGILIALPVIVLADSFIFSWAFGLYFKESAIFAAIFLASKVGVAMIFG